MAIGFFDGNKADASPESIKRKREMIARMMASARSPRNIGEGFNAIGNNIAAAMLGRQSDEEERRVNAERSRIMAGLFGGGGAPMAAVGGAPVATGAVSGKGYDNPQARETYEYALAQGLAPHQAAAYTSAKLAESRFDPNARNPGDGRDGTDSIGVFQWNSGRAQALKQFAAQQGKSWNDPAVQRAFSFAELNGSERAAGQALRAAKTPEEATAAMLSYLRPGGWTSRNPLGAHSAPARLRNTQGILSAFGGMPVISPGPGAAPMPLARQQAQTAPMPNAGLADLPAPGANQSGMNVAPVQGDNAQQLLADADYYEQNGNPEAARQMRERAQMAGQLPAPDGAFQAPLDGSQPDPLRDMFSARDVGFADNEAETQGLEARMAQEQGVAPAPDPSQVQTVAITPNAQNADDVYSPIPMGFGRNPFLPRDMAPPADAMAQAAPAPAPGMDRATFDQITGQQMPVAPTFTRGQFNPPLGGDPDVAAQSADPTAISPRMVTAPMPPRRPADLGPQSPFVPPAMRQPMSMDFGGENSGGAMQFIESEFARREGRPDPRTAMGAPGQIYNPFVQQPPQAPQMPAGGGSVQGVSQGGAMASGPAQAPAQAQATRPGMIPERDLVAVLTSGLTTEAQKKFAMDTLTQQRAMQQAEAERARVQAANERAARAAGVDPALLENPVIGKAATEAKFREAPETFRDLTPAERTQRGIDPNDKRPYQISNRTGKVSGVGGTQIVNNMRTEGAIPPGYRAVRDPQGNVERIEPIPGSQQAREIQEAEEKKGKSKVQDARYANVIFRSVADIDQNMKGSWFPTTGTIGQALSGVAGTNAHNVARAIDAIKANIGFERLSAMRAASPTGGALGGIAVKELELLTASAGNLEQSQSADQFRRNLERLRSDFEMVIHGRTFSPEERKLMAASEAAQADQGRARPNFIDQNAARPQPTPAQSSAALQNARKAIADGAPREAVIDRLRQAGIDPGGL
jgi:hypothetical protein